MPTTSMRRGLAFPWRWVAAVVCGTCLPAAAATPPPPVRIELAADIPGAGDLAAPANGQTLYVLDETRGEVAALDPFEPSKRRLAVGAEGTVQPVAIACVDTGMLATLCREKDGWSLRTHRVRPDAVADAASPAQRTPLEPPRGGAAAATPNVGRPCLVVSPSRDWLAVCGLPAPLPPVMRAPIAGSRVGNVSAKGCPTMVAVRPEAAAISLGEELVLLLPAEQGRTFLSYFLPPVPRPLLHLDAGLERVIDAGFCRADGTLWVVASGSAADGGEAEGLWRIDAVLRDGRQAAQAVLVARLEAPRSLVALSERAVVVVHGRERRVVSRIDPTKQSGAQP